MAAGAVPRFPARARRAAVAALLAVSALTACGTEAPDPVGEAGRGTFPATVSDAKGEVVVPARPQRIVSLSPTATEILYAIGAGGQVAAVDDQSNYPEQAPRTKLSGFQPNAEAVAAQDPDLVVLSTDVNEIVASLRALDIPTIEQPAAATLDDAYEQIRQLGVATGHVGEAETVVESMQARIDALVRSAPERALTYYHELDQKLFTVTSSTFIGQVYAMIGLDNVADAAPGADTGYPQLSAEYLIKADPDVIFLADSKCCAQSAETVRARPGWDRMAAVRAGAIVELDDDVASRWGPRIVELLEIVAEAVSELEPAA